MSLHLRGLLLLLVVGSLSPAQTISARLDLVAVDQSTDPLIYEGDFDIYHLVVDSQIGGAGLVELEFGGLDLIESDFGAQDTVRVGAALDSIVGNPIPYSFVVSGGFEPRQLLVFDAELTDSSLRATYGAFAGLLFPAIGDGVPTNETKIAVLSVPAGSPKPALSGTIGTAFTPDTIGIVASTGPLPGDSTGDRTVDLLDLDVQSPTFPQPPRPSWPDSLDFNQDGVGDNKDVAILAANYGRTLLDDPNLVQTFVTDVTATEIVIDPAFLPGGPFDLLDLDILGANFGSTRATVSQRDLNGDQVVDLLDLDLLGQGFSTVPSSVPEPGTVALLLLTAAGCHCRPSRTR